MFKTLILLFLKVSRHTTASTLYKGTINAIASDVSPALPSPKRDVVTGKPNSTKLERNTPCINTPHLLLSFMNFGTITINSINKISIKVTAYNIKFKSNTLSTLVV